MRLLALVSNREPVPAAYDIVVEHTVKHIVEHIHEHIDDNITVYLKIQYPADHNLYFCQFFISLVIILCLNNRIPLH